jgi:hypothetical protein
MLGLGDETRDRFPGQHLGDDVGSRRRLLRDARGRADGIRGLVDQGLAVERADAGIPRTGCWHRADGVDQPQPGVAVPRFARSPPHGVESRLRPVDTDHDRRLGTAHTHHEFSSSFRTPTRCCPTVRPSPAGRQELWSPRDRALPRAGQVVRPCD